jgi:hypothetical protein
MKEEGIRDVLDYDPETGVFRWKKNRGRRYCAGRLAGSFDKDGYRIVTVLGWRLRCGRLAWWFVHGTWPVNEIDHINLVRSDDRIANLRLASRQENAANKGNHKKRMPFPKGVAFKGDRPRARPWVAHIRRNGVKKHLGHFASMADAGEAYQREAVRAMLLQGRDQANETRNGENP